MKKLISFILLVFCSFAVKSQTFSWTGWSSILDLQPDTVQINVSGLPSVIDTTFGVAHICMDITHTYVADLSIRLVSPSGTSVLLIQSSGGSGHDFTGTCVGMDGTAFSNGDPPYNGIFYPEGNITLFNNGQNPNGTWLFIVTDQANSDTGSVHTASIVFVNNPPRLVPVSGGPAGVTVRAGVVCPGGASSCDLLPDMTASAKEIQVNHNEVAPGVEAADTGFLYISNATPNIGYGPIEIFGIDSCYCENTPVPCNTVCPNGIDLQHIVVQRIYHKVAGTDTLTHYDRFAGRMTYHASHGHIHVDHWANYTLRTATSNPDAKTWPIVGAGIKQSFCLINLGTCGGNPGECVDNNGNPLTTFPNNNLGFNTGCGYNQGIYVGNYDVYSISLNEPIPLVDVCNGLYYVVSITDMENNFLESDETNNWVAVPILLTKQGGGIPTITGAATFCPGGSTVLTSSNATNYKWSTGATTKTITVNTPGTYSVTTDTTLTCSGTSLPFTTSYVTMSISPSTPQICLDDSVQLVASTTAQIQNDYTAGTGVIVNSSTIYPAPYGNWYWGARHQFLVRKTELLAAGLTAGQITALSFDVSAVNSAPVHVNFTIKIKSTTLDSITAFQTGLTTVRSPLNHQPVVGWNKHTFDTPFNWDGNSNIIVETCFNNSSYLSNGNASVRQSATAYRSTIYYRADNSIVCGTNTVSAPYTQRPNMRFSRAVPITYSWSPLSGLNDGTIANPFAKPSSTTTYSVAATNQCNTSGQVTVTVNTCGTDVTLNLKFFIEGLYSDGLMQAVLYDNAMSNDPTACDSIIVELHLATSPYDLVATTNGLLHTNGTAAVSFPFSILNQSYYICILHRNMIETWSKNAVLINSSVMSFDFTSP